MNFSLNSKTLVNTKADCLVVALPEKGDWPASTTEADSALGGLISKLQKAGDVSAKIAATSLIPLNDQPWSRLLVIGTGKDEDRPPSSFRKALVAMTGSLKDGPSKTVLIALSDTPVTGDDSARSELAKLSLIGRTLEDQLYTFNDFKSEKPPARKLSKILIAASDTGKAHKEAFNLGLATGRGMNFTRDLGNTPPNICHPVWLAEQASKMASDHDCIKTDILDEKQMQKLGMNSLLAVGRGSSQPSRLIIMEYRGGNAKDKPHVLVGKGITFDTGGISLKPGAGMDEMKYDMGLSVKIVTERLMKSKAGIYSAVDDQYNQTNVYVVYHLSNFADAKNDTDLAKAFERKETKFQRKDPDEAVAEEEKPVATKPKATRKKTSTKE
ncbi:hypothetical protein LCGC14_2338070 [marine sediment metagenome]|uniref:Cytosol aminopeptidase domain-containing protein n=1 Tax=marine sediment metagenome TaxID=412755 RepID=A0A0F9D0B0_9ZZZZ